MPVATLHNLTTTGTYAPDEHNAYTSRLIEDTKWKKEDTMSNNEALSELQAYRQSNAQIHLDRIIRGNIGLILKCARIYQNMAPCLNMADLGQASLEGFIYGLNKFKFEFSKKKVASYAATYSRNKILLHIEEEHPNVRIGRKVLAKARAGNKQMEQWMRTHEHTAPPLDLILSEMGASKTERIGALQVYPSKEEVVDSDFEPKNQPLEDIDDLFENRLLKVCRMLEGEEKRLVFARFGIDTSPPFFIVCVELGIDESTARTRVRQILKRIKNAPEIDELRYKAGDKVVVLNNKSSGHFFAIRSIVRVSGRNKQGWNLIDADGITQVLFSAEFTFA